MGRHQGCRARRARESAKGESQRDLGGSDARVEAPRPKLQPSHRALETYLQGLRIKNLTPEIPAARDEEQAEDAWWGEGIEWPDGSQDQGFAMICDSTGLSFGPQGHRQSCLQT